MNSTDRTIRDRDAYVENFAAELTDAAYPVALRHGVAGSSIDLELDLIADAPYIPTLPFDHGCFATHSIVSYPSR